MTQLAATPPDSALPQVSRLGAASSLLLLTTIFMACTGTFERFGVSAIVWLLIYGITAIQIVGHHKQVIQSVHSSWFILLLPLVAFLSTFWSADPGRSFYASIQFMYTTLIGIWIGSTFAPRRIFQTLCLATGIGVLASVINESVQLIPAYDQADYVGAERFLVGIFAQKNVLGFAIDLFALSLIVVGFQTGKLLPMIFFALLLWFPLRAAHAVSATLVFVFTLTLPLIWWTWGKERSKIVFALLGWIAALAMIFTAFAVDIDLVDRSLESLGKDSTLTGRTYLWSIGWQTFLDHPVLGVGYQAFWQPGIFRESQMMRNALGETINGFHSAYIEVLVATGVVGVVVFVALLAGTLSRCIRWFKRDPSIEGLGSIFLLVSVIILAPIEVVIFRQHEIFYLLTVTFFVASYREIRVPEGIRCNSLPKAVGHVASRL